MNKILNFKKKLQVNSGTKKETKATTSILKNNTKTTTSKAAIQDERKKVVKSTPGPVATALSSKVFNSNSINISGGGSSISKSNPLLLQSMFNKGKRSSEITNKKVPTIPFSDELFINNTNNKPIINNNNNNNTNLKPQIPIPTTAASSSTILIPSTSNRVRDNIQLLKENSKNEYKTRVNEIEKLVLQNNNTNHSHQHDNNIQKIILVEKEMINTFDSMINLQTSQNTTYHQILKTSSRLSSNNNGLFIFN